MLNHALALMKPKELHINVLRTRSLLADAIEKYILLTNKVKNYENYDDEKASEYNAKHPILKNTPIYRKKSCDFCNETNAVTSKLIDMGMKTCEIHEKIKIVKDRIGRNISKGVV